MKKRLKDHVDMENRYIIRTATGTDVDDMVRMRLSLEKHMFDRNPHLWRWSEKRTSEQADMYLKMMQNEDILLLVISDENAGCIVGMGFGLVSRHDRYMPDKSGRIEDIWIDPDHRRKGLCKRLVAELVDLFDSQGIHSLTLTYAEGNREAEQVWHKLGFKTVLHTANASLSDVRVLCKK